MRAFANVPTTPAPSDPYALDDLRFKKLFRQIFNIAERFKDVPSAQDPHSGEYWADLTREIGQVSNEWQLRDPATGFVLVDDQTGAAKFHPLFVEMASAILDSYQEIWKARSSVEGT